ncbi:hypothetical protein H5410_006940 [Solanum commersonii]|uniref:Uncharacterized protein n=1 Tax=Solanum commersonii TaxID=4109 RepID=A0A9J6AC06_SOLCO|nr:hypothetical protein H5410_006940 [Solanum commersonii]
MSNLFYVVSIQGWNHLFEPPVPYLHEPEVREFFYKIELLESGGITTTVRNVEICPDEEILGIIIGVLWKEFERSKIVNHPVTSQNLPQNVEMSRMQGY